MFGLTPNGSNRKRGELVRRNDFFNVRSMFDDFFGDSFLPSFFASSNPIKADIRETDKEYIIDAEIPGAKKEDIKIELRDDMLTIALEHDEQVNEERENYIRKERRYGSCSRSFYIENVKNDKVEAKYNDGILTITLPKSDEVKNKRHNIEIQ